MNRADRMLSVLRDGREHSREEIEQLAPGKFFLTNNAASDLRKRGFDVKHRVKDGHHMYRLRPLSSATGEPSSDALSPSLVALLSERPPNPSGSIEQTHVRDDGQLALSVPRGAYQ